MCVLVKNICELSLISWNGHEQKMVICVGNWMFWNIYPNDVGSEVIGLQICNNLISSIPTEKTTWS